MQRYSRSIPLCIGNVLATLYLIGLVMLVSNFSTESILIELLLDLVGFGNEISRIVHTVIMTFAVVLGWMAWSDCRKVLSAVSVLCYAIAIVVVPESITLIALPIIFVIIGVLTMNKKLVMPAYVPVM